MEERAKKNRRLAWVLSMVALMMILITVYWLMQYSAITS